MNWKAMPGNKIIIGIVGEIASGKGTAAEYLKKKYDGTIFKFSTPLRDVLKRLHLDESRENLQTLSLSLRNCFGGDLFSKVIANDAASSSANLIITDGIRRPNDIVELAKLPGFNLIAIQANEKIRYERVKARNENANDANKTWDDFKKDAAAETEMTIRDISAKAEYTVSNNGSLEELYQALDEIVDKIR
jgi:dephospho-CoA kinase